MKRVFALLAILLAITLIFNSRPAVQAQVSPPEDPAFLQLPEELVPGVELDAVDMADLMAEPQAVTPTYSYRSYMPRTLIPSNPSVNKSWDANGCIYSTTGGGFMIDPVLFHGQVVTNLHMTFFDSDPLAGHDPKIWIERWQTGSSFHEPLVVLSPAHSTTYEGTMRTYSAATNFKVDMKNNSYTLEVNLPANADPAKAAKICSIMLFYQQPLGFVAALPAVVK